YRLCYRACAGGPFRWPALAGEVTRVLGPAPPEPIELWDNDAIVNTTSMLWPKGETLLVLADHLDIVGHYELVNVPGLKRVEVNYEPARIYQAYDAFRSVPRFTDRMFEEVWTEIFEFATNPQAFDQRKETHPK